MFDDYKSARHQQRIEYNCAQLLETFDKERLPAAAWLTRNLLELFVWVKYCGGARVTRMTNDEAVLKTSEDEERAIAEEVLTLAINALRDIAESRRMPSGIVVTQEVAARHRAAAGEFETLRRYMSGGRPP